MPSGTGKTVTLLSLITSYQLAHPEVGKLIYCSRTVPEIEKVLEEAKRVLGYREKELGDSAAKALCLGMSARRNLCAHPRVSQFREGRVVDSLCRDLISPWNREKAKTSQQQLHSQFGVSETNNNNSSSSIETCSFYEKFMEGGGLDVRLHGVFTIEDIREFGTKQGWCPYFLSRHSINHADIVVFSYQYVIDPKITELISKEFKSNCILVFDEAHNIDNVCIDALSINITKQMLEASNRNLKKLLTIVERTKSEDEARLKKEYDKLVQGLAQNVSEGQMDILRTEPVLNGEATKEVVPGNIRKSEHFIGLLRRLIEFLKAKLKTTTVFTESTLSFLQSLYTSTAIEAKSLRFCSARLGSLFHSLQISDIAEFHSVSLVADFATLIGTYSKGFTIITDPFHSEWNEAFGDGPRQDNNPIIQFCCLDASLAMKPVIAKYRSVVITSGTLSPLDIYPRMLDFVPVLTERFPMTLTRACVCPLIVTRGSDQVAVSSKYELRNDPSVIRNFGNILVEMSGIVPDGIVCFFTSYSYMEQIVSLWHEMGLLKNVLANKLLFVETPDPVETAIAMENYKKACNNGRGAVLFSVARGKVSEGIDFDNQYGRAVLMFGIPFVNTESRVLKARLEYLRTNHQIKENEFLSFDAMRNTAQCVGRVIRGKNDYGIMVFVDKRYNRMDKRNKLPQWISDAMQPSHLNLSTDMAVGVAKNFLKEMAQPWAKEDQIGKSLWTLEHIENLGKQVNK